MADGATIVGSKAALPAFKAGEGAGVKQLNLKSNKGNKTVNIVTGLVNFSYYESILQDVIRASVTFTDTGDSVDGKTVMEGLPVYGSESASIWIEDNNKKNIRVELFVNKPDDLLDDTRKRVCILNFASKEFFDNEKVRLSTRFDGLISQSVKNILTKATPGRPQGGQGGDKSRYSGGGKGSEKIYLNTEKELFIEDTSNNRNFNGNNWKPFYTINWLATQAVPSGQENTDAPGNSAGFMFWETADGFHFKSIDALMNTETNPVKRRFIYNETSEGPCSGEMPEGYDAKVLEMTVDNRVNVQEKLKMGAYSTRTWMFNPYDTSVEILYPHAFNVPSAETIQSIAQNAKGNQDYLKLAGEELPIFNPEFNQEIDFSRTFFKCKDVGTLPTGDGSGKDCEQIKESKKENSLPGETLGQGVMRMNQLFASKVVITIPGDFELRAGDAVYFDAPGLRKDKNEKGTDELDKHIGGNYVIASICHYLDGANTLTKMDLVRDSFGRKAQERSSTTAGRTTGSKPNSEKQKLSSGTEKFNGVTVPRSRGGNFL